MVGLRGMQTPLMFRYHIKAVNVIWSKKSAHVKGTLVPLPPNFIPARELLSRYMQTCDRPQEFDIL